MKGDDILSRLSFWDTVSSEYDGFYRSRWSQIEDACVSKWLELIDVEGKVLDLGCGTGYVGRLLAKSGICLTGVDYSNGMLARAEAENHYSSLIQHDLNLPLEGAIGGVDTIVSTWGSLNYLNHPVNSLEAALLQLRADGQLFIMVFNNRSLRRISRGMSSSGEMYGTRGNQREDTMVQIPSLGDWKIALEKSGLTLESHRSLGAFSGILEFSWLWRLDCWLCANFNVGHMYMLHGIKK